MSDARNRNIGTEGPTAHGAIAELKRHPRSKVFVRDVVARHILLMTQGDIVVAAGAEPRELAIGDVRGLDGIKRVYLVHPHRAQL